MLYKIPNTRYKIPYIRIDILTLHPAMFEGPLTQSILGRARDAGAIDIHTHDLHEWGLGNYRQVDDEPYGGGAGMVFRVDVVVPAIEAVVELGREEMQKSRKAEMQQAMQKSRKAEKQKSEPYKIYLSARGEVLKQEKVESIAAEHEWLLLLCGHYEGIDNRIIEGGWIDEEVSIGEYVLTGGELPAMVLIDAVARHIPGVLGKQESAHEESYSAALDRKKEYPHYTRPEEFRGLTVPDVLLSGHHKQIEEWRKGNTM